VAQLRLLWGLDGTLVMCESLNEEDPICTGSGSGGVGSVAYGSQQT